MLRQLNLSIRTNIKPLIKKSTQITFGLLFFCSIGGYGQQLKASKPGPELMEDLVTAKTWEDSTILYMELAIFYVRRELELSEKFVTAGLNLARKNESISYETDFTYVLARLRYAQGKNGESKRLFNWVEKHFDELAVNMHGGFWHYRGYLNLRNGNLDSALVCFTEQYQLFADDPEERAFPLSSIANVYSSMGDWPSAGKYYDQAIEDSGDYMTKAIALIEAAPKAFNNKDYERHARYIKIYTDMMADRDPRNITHPSKIERLFPSELSFEDREKGLLEEIAALNKLKANSAAIIVEQILINNYLQNGMYEQTIEQIESLRQSIADKGLKIGFSTHKFFHESSSYAYEKMGQYEKAFIASKLLRSYQDSMNTSIILAKGQEFRAKFDVESAELELKQQNDLLAQKKRESLLWRLLSFCIIGFAAFSFYIMRKSTLKSRRISSQQRLLDEKRIADLENERRMLSLAMVLKGQEKERVRIAQDLHDGLGGMLSSVKAHVTNLNSMLQNSDSDISGLDKASGLIDEACTEVRRISQNLMPNALRLAGLKGALEHIADELHSTHKIDVSCDIRGLAERLDQTTEVFVYRIVQELCNNIVKYSKANEVLIQLAEFEQELMLIVEDNGRGFNLDEVDAKTSVGINSIRSRVIQLNGDIDINTKPGHGTSVTINIPLEKSA